MPDTGTPHNVDFSRAMTNPMPALNLDACASTVAVNRLIAERFAEKARRLLELIQSINDVQERMRIADVMHFAEQRSALHTSIANLQERDMGVRCHCPSPTKSLGDNLSLNQHISVGPRLLV
jgi:hypothetical protein